MEDKPEIKELSQIFTYIHQQPEDGPLESVLEAFKKLISNTFSFGWYIRPDRLGAYFLTGYKVDDPKLHIYLHQFDTPVYTIYPDRIERHFPDMPHQWGNGNFLGILGFIQHQADIHYETHIKPILHDYHNLRAPEGFTKRLD